VAEPGFVRLFLPILVGCAAFYVVQALVAAAAYRRARKKGSMRVGMGARRFWLFGGLALFTVLGIYAAVVIDFRRTVQLKQIRAYEATSSGDKAPRKALIRELKVERNVGGVMFVAIFVAGLMWRGAAHEEGWVSPEVLGVSADGRGDRG